MFAVAKPGAFQSFFMSKILRHTNDILTLLYRGAQLTAASSPPGQLTAQNAQFINKKFRHADLTLTEYNPDLTKPYPNLTQT